MFIPFSTDAPLYHWPIVTVSMIVINTLVFFTYPLQSHYEVTDFSTEQLTSIVEQLHDEGVISDEEYDEAIEELETAVPGEFEDASTAEDGDPFTLQYGQGLKPWQWITGHFLHADFMHLLGNMLWLWTFGLIVEGKIGWWKFLAVYMGIGVVEGFMEQTLMLGMQPLPWNCSVGASSIIFGIMAIAMIWAPANDVHCTFVLFVRPFQFSLPVAGLGGFYLLYNVAMAVFFTYDGEFITPTSELLHTLGGIVGLAVGIGMLQMNMVDCENWDVFSVWSGRNRMSREELRDLNSDQAAFQEKQQQHVSSGLAQIREILREGHSPKLAYRAHLSMKQKYEDWKLPDAEFLMTIKQLCDQQMWEDATLAMGEYLKTPRSKHDQVRLKLASILLDQLGRPSQCLAVLSKVAKNQLSAREKGIYQQLIIKANKAKEEGVIDTLEDW
ncbi:rhomboid family intramembrane serine protease [Bremerella sp. JC770]|uniref:rhomboid family intramembrane serine protease n=1 Tax=Bremerella sp. JC770 TaxID=3232137 RepID=UPI0034598B9D